METESLSKQSLRKAAAILGRKGGLVKSTRKTIAVRRNAKLGGRPKKQGTKASKAQDST